MDTERAQSQLDHMLDKLFQKHNLEKNIYIFNQMKQNLEIPTSMVLKERKIVQVAPDDDSILKALKRCSRVALSEDSKTLRILLPSTKTRVIVPAHQNVLGAIPRIAGQSLFSGYKWQVDKNNAIINANNQAETAVFKELLEKETGTNCTIEACDVYLDLKDSIQKAKQSKKDRTSYTGYQGFSQWPSPNSYNLHSYAGSIQNPRGPGFTRKAVDSDQEEENTPVINKDCSTNPAVIGKLPSENHSDHNDQIDQKNYIGREQYKEIKQHRGEQAQQKNHNKVKQDKEKKLKYRQKESKPENQDTQATIQRVRFDSQNFPEIEHDVDKQVLKIKYTKADLVQIYAKTAPNIPISPNLQHSGIPLLSVQGLYKLQAMKAGGRKESTFDTPKLLIMGRKSST